LACGGTRGCTGRPCCRLCNLRVKGRSQYRSWRVREPRERRCSGSTGWNVGHWYIARESLSDCCSFDGSSDLESLMWAVFCCYCIREIKKRTHRDHNGMHHCDPVRYHSRSYPSGTSTAQLGNLKWNFPYLFFGSSSYISTSDLEKVRLLVSF